MNSQLLLKRTPKRPQTAASFAFDTCIVIYNPVSTRSARAMRYAQEVRAAFPEQSIVYIPTSPKGRAANQALLVSHADKLSDKTLIVVVGGDGTANLVVDTLLNDTHLTEVMRRATVLPLWGGNGNDLAHMLNGAPRRAAAQHVLQSGKRITIHPLSCAITADGKTTTHTAICYASFGASAFAARRLESLRGVRPFFHAMGAFKFVHEISMVSRALIGAPLFMISDTGKTKTIYDQLFLNGSRFAKVNRTPLKLTDPRFLHVVVEQKRLSAMVFHIAELTRRHLERYTVTDECITFTLEQAAWAQLDGEVTYLGAGTTVQVSLAKQAFYALSTVLL